MSARATVAAMNAYSRKVIGLRNMLDKPSASYDLLACTLKPMHAVVEFRPPTSGDWWMQANPEPQPGSIPVMHWAA